MTEVMKNPISFSSSLSNTNSNAMRSIKHYEAKPPTNFLSQSVDPENVLATTKEEEWVTKKKTELTTKKQIETRVKRQVVLADGKIVEDSGPIVTTNTTEDTEKQEHQQTEHRQVGDDEPEGWIAVPNSTGLVKQVKENKVKSREETEERLETEDVQHLGDITDDAYLKAIQSQKKDLRLALRQASGELLNSTSLTPYNGRIVHHSVKNKKTIDREDTKHSSEAQNDGRLITETTTTVEHEEVTNTAEPDDGQEEEDYETQEHSSQRYKKTKDQELVEYVADGVKMGEQIRFEAENVEGDRQGNADGLKMQFLEWDDMSQRVRRMREEKQLKLLQEADRKDALTKKPLNHDLEEETRKVETSKWLDHHFGSESRSSKSSLGDENDDHDEDDGNGRRRDRKAKRSTSFINVTMKSTKSPRPRSPAMVSVDLNDSKRVSDRIDGSDEHPSPLVTAKVDTYKSTAFKSSDRTKSRDTATKNIYEIQSGSIKKIPSAQRTFGSVPSSSPTSSLFRPIGEKSRTQARTSGSRVGERVSSPISTTELDSSATYASVQRKNRNTSTVDKAASSSSSSPMPSPPPSPILKTLKKPAYNGEVNVIRNSLVTQSDDRRNSNRITKIETDHQPERRSILVGRNNLNKSWSRSERRLADISDSDVQKEPDPDYSPRLRKKVYSTPDMRISPQRDEAAAKKKMHQKTRFAVDMPLVKRSKSTRTSGNRSERKSVGIGETFRKFIGKFHNHNKDAGAEKAKKWRNDSPSSSLPRSRPPPPSSGGYYQAFGNVDNHIATGMTSNDSEDVGEMEKSGRESPLPKQAAKHFSTEESNNANVVVVSKKRVTTPSPSPPPPPPASVRRSSALTNAAPYPFSQTLDRNYRVKKKQSDDSMFKRRSPVQKYYLGEDPFNGSIYGREKEYDAAATKPFKRKYKNGNTEETEKKSVRSQILNGVSNIFGGRLGKSNNKLSSDSNQKSKKVHLHHIDYTNRGGIQTLPRKSKKQVYINDPSSDQENLHSRKSLNRNASSMINVSVINGSGGRSSTFKSSPDILGPRKPARTYRTSLLRSKSFNVQLGPYGHERSLSSSPSPFKSNPQLHKLEESQAPLKSPGIVTSISRSTRDLSKSATNTDDDDYRHSNFHNYHTNGYTSSSSYDNSSRRVFLKGLKSRAPELYKTLHEDDESDSQSHSPYTCRPTTSTTLRNKPKQRLLEYSNSFHGGGSSLSHRKPTVSFESDRTLSRLPVVSDSNGGGSDDYSETVRITSKSTDPIRPSVTNTVQSFSKKTIPSKDGRVETIESSETTRVTKSHYRGGDSDNDSKTTNNYNTKNGSVVIEVRNDRK